MDKIEKIRAEIERRLNILTNVYAEQVERKDEEMMNYYHGKVIALEELRPFLDSLSEESDKGLEEAAESYTDSSEWLIGENLEHIEAAFIAGAEWAMRYQEKKIADAYEKGKQEGVRVVRSWESSPGQGGY